MRLGACLVLAFVVLNGLLPMVFDFDPRRAAAAVAAADIIPFFSYVQNRFDVMLDDMSEKLAAYFILCFLLTGCSRSVSHMSTKSRVTSVIVFAFATSLVMEVIQMFIPVRVPSLTDPILAVVGASTGVLAWFVAADFHRFVVADAQREDEAIPAGSMQPVLGLVDSVIASLMEPHAKAPRERAPKRAPTKGK
jgi:VanZ family protein